MPDLTIDERLTITITRSTRQTEDPHGPPTQSAVIIRMEDDTGGEFLYGPGDNNQRFLERILRFQKNSDDVGARFRSDVDFLFDLHGQGPVPEVRPDQDGV